jgi:hypothetical protein
MPCVIWLGSTDAAAVPASVAPVAPRQQWRVIAGSELIAMKKLIGGWWRKSRLF